MRHQWRGLSMSRGVSTARTGAADALHSGQGAAGAIRRHATLSQTVTGRAPSARGRNRHAVMMVSDLRRVADTRLTGPGARSAARDRRALGRGGAGARVAGASVVDGGDLSRGASRNRDLARHLRGVASEAGDASPGDASHRSRRQLPGLAIILGADRRAGGNGVANRNRVARAAVSEQLAVGGGHALGSGRRSGRATLARAARHSGRAASARAARRPHHSGAAAAARDAAARDAAARTRGPTRAAPARAGSRTAGSSSVCTATGSRSARCRPIRVCVAATVSGLNGTRAARRHQPEEQSRRRQRQGSDAHAPIVRAK